MVNKGDYLDFVKTIDKKTEYSTSMEIIIELVDKIEQLENRIKELEK